MVVDERRKEVSDDQLLMRNGDARADVIDLFSGIQIVGFPRAGVSGGSAGCLESVEDQSNVDKDQLI